MPAPNPPPPRIARAIMLALAPRRLREQLDGDLAEGFTARRQRAGRWHAHAWYWRQLFSPDVLRLRRVARRGGTPRRRSSRLDPVAGVRYAIRGAVRNPGYALVVVGTLAIGIGANTAIFAAVRGILLEPLPYPESDRLAMVFRTAPRFGFQRSTVSFPDFADWRRATRTFASLAAYGRTQLTFMGATGAEQWTGYRVTAGLLPLLGVGVAMGRGFDAGDDRPGAGPVLMLSHQAWHTHFGGDTAVVGRALTLDGTPRTVIGVMPAGFQFPGGGPSFWIPLGGDAERMERDSNFLTVIGRLAAGVSIDDAQGELAGLAASIDGAAPGANDGMGVFVEPRHAFEVGSARTALLVFFGAVGLVLAIACVNVANLMLARSTSRHRELAMRTALGASPTRLLHQLLTETLVLAFVGGALGVAIAHGLVAVFRITGPADLAHADRVAVDLVTLGYTAFIALACGVAFGTAPALLGSRAAGRHALREGGPTDGLGRGARRAQQTFAVVQIALAVVLAVGAGLLINSFARLITVQPGFDPSNVVAARVAPQETDMPPMGRMDAAIMREMMRRAGEERARFFDAVLAGARGLPGVESAALVYSLPFGGHGYSRTIVPEAMTVEPGDEPVVSGNVIAGDYFATMGIPLLRGRGFEASDGADAPLVAAINQTMAQLFWPSDNPLGKRFRAGDGDRPWITVVGLVADVRRRSLAEEDAPQFYRPLAQVTWPDGMFVALRTTVPPATVVQSLRQMVWDLDIELPVTDVAVAADLIAESIATPRFRTVVLATFGGIAVLLAIVGIYGVMAYAVGERRREIGIRMALGAGRRTILVTVLRRGLGLSGAGVVIGVAAAISLARFLSGMLFGLTPYDPTTYVAVVVVVLAVATVACYAPAWRAARTDPLETLRNE